MHILTTGADRRGQHQYAGKCLDTMDTTASTANAPRYTLKCIILSRLQNTHKEGTLAPTAHIFLYFTQYMYILNIYISSPYSYAISSHRHKCIVT